MARLCHCCLNIPFDSLIWTVSNICRKARPALFIGKGESGSDSSNKCGQGIFNPACSFDCFDDDAHQSTYPYFASSNTCLGACLNRCKYGLLLKKARTFMQDGLIQWQDLINYEKNRQNAILKVFSQFTDVRGLQQQAKRRKYLDVLLPKSKMVYDYLLSEPFAQW